MITTRRTLMQLAVGLLASTALPMAAFAASNIASDLQQPLWYQEPSAKTLELAKIDDLSNTVVSDGQRGEKGVLGSSIQITDEQAAKIKAGNFTVGIAMGWLGDDWASEQLIGLKETFAKYGVKVVAETNADWDDAKQISNLETIAVLKPSLVVSIPLNGKTTAGAFKKIAANQVAIPCSRITISLSAWGDEYGLIRQLLNTGAEGNTANYQNN